MFLIVIRLLVKFHYMSSFGYATQLYSFIDLLVKNIFSNKSTYLQVHNLATFFLSILPKRHILLKKIKIPESLDLSLGLANQFQWDADACNMTGVKKAVKIPITTVSEESSPQNKPRHMFLNFDDSLETGVLNMPRPLAYIYTAIFIFFFF